VGYVVSIPPNHAMSNTANQPEAVKTRCGLSSATYKAPFACFSIPSRDGFLWRPGVSYHRDDSWLIAVMAEALSFATGDSGRI
jgi:hypothetical protein